MAWWLRICLLMQGARVHSLVRELDPTCMPQTNKQTNKQIKKKETEYKIKNDVGNEVQGLGRGPVQRGALKPKLH